MARAAAIAPRSFWRRRRSCPGTRRRTGLVPWPLGRGRRGAGRAERGDPRGRPRARDRFVELRYHFTTGGKRPFRFEGRGFYRAEGAVWHGQWFDSTGATRPLTGKVAGTALTTEWGDEATERGRTTYRLEAADALKVTDEVFRRDGRWHVFASHRLTRN